MPRYIAAAPLFVADRRVAEGQEFVSDLPPGEYWKLAPDNPEPAPRALPAAARPGAGRRGIRSQTPTGSPASAGAPVQS